MSAKTRTVKTDRMELTRRPVFLTACVAGLAAAVVGCSNQSTSRTTGYTGSTYTNQLANRSTAKVDPSAKVGRYEPQWYVDRAGQVELPPLWLGEAVQSTADVQSIRAEAISTRIATQAKENAALAQAEAELRAAMSNEQIAIAEADGTQNAYDAKVTELTMQVTSQESAFESKARLNDALLESMIKERQAEFESMRSQAVKEFGQAEAQHQRMLGQRAAVEQNGLVEIAQMVKIADMTESRAASKVQALRSEADAFSKQTKAKVSGLNQQIKSLAEQIGAESSALREKAASLEEEGKATSHELLVKAQSLEERDLDQEFGLKQTGAELKFEKAQSQHHEWMQQADATVTEAEAAIERLRAAAEEFMLISEADLHQQKAATERFREHGLADVFVQRAQAERIEREARAEFVKSQAEALATAAREEAAHLNELAEKQFEQIKSQAEADAARIRAEMIATLAQQIQKGSTELPGKTDGTTGTTTNKKTTGGNQTGTTVVTANDAVPAKPDVPVKPAVMEPEHVAKFKSALAQVTKVRVQADAHERAILATFQERTQKLDAWWQQQQAKYSGMIAEASGFGQQAIAKADAIRSKAEKSLRLAQAEMKREFAEADAFRKETFAQITNLRAQGQKVFEQNKAEATRLLAQAEALDNGGAAEIRALEAQRDAVRRRGEAQVRTLVADANSIGSTQKALVAQMRQEINSAQHILKAELARLDQTAESFMQIAEATYQEAVTVSDTFAEKTRIASNKIQIENDVDRQIAQVGVDHLRNLVNAQELAGRAEVERLVAHAAADREFAESGDIAKRAGIYAQSQISDAFVNAKLAAADAKDENVRSIFESRIASVQADRDRAFAQKYLSDTQQQARLAKAQAAAAAYRDMSVAAVALLNEKKFAFENAAKQNWDARLAMPAGSVELEWPTLDPDFNMPGEGQPFTPPAFVNVTEDFDFQN